MSRCNEVLASCICGLEKDHEPPHKCVDQNTCHGSWEIKDGEVVVHVFPGGYKTEAEAERAYIAMIERMLQ